MDTFTKQKRSEVMAKIRGKDTKPEKIVRSLLHQMGFRFRLHNKMLPGKPDICLPKHETVIFVHGCFWHNHTKCKGGRLPKSNLEYWQPKIQRNVERDKMRQRSLRKLGWKVIVIWECELKAENRLRSKIQKSLSDCR